MKIRNERLAAVAAGSAIVVLLGSVTAFAAGKITSHDIQNHTIQTKDMSHQAKQALRGHRGPRGHEGPQGPAGEPFKYQGANWSIVDRNVIGNGDSYLRAGPNGVNLDGTPEEPPYGVGSLGLRTGSPDDAAAFGDQVDFAGDALSGLKRVEYDVYTTQENNDKAANNLPSVKFEVFTTGQGGYSTLIYAPESADANKWTHLDASSAKRWYYTGTPGEASGCNQVTYCTLDEATAKFPNGKVLTALIGKGRDYAFSGAVDGLIINDQLFDFEPTGVKTSAAPAASTN